MWKEVAKLIPFGISQFNFWKFGMARGTFKITLPDWRVKVNNVCFNKARENNVKSVT